MTHPVTVVSALASIEERWDEDDGASLVGLVQIAGVTVFSAEVGYRATTHDVEQMFAERLAKVLGAGS